jgi:hypothetical protein
MREGLGNEVDCIDETIVRDSQLTLVPRNDRSFEHGLRFVHLLRSPRFSQAGYVDTESMNLLTRMFQAPRHL